MKTWVALGVNQRAYLVRRIHRSLFPRMLAAVSIHGARVVSILLDRSL